MLELEVELKLKLKEARRAARVVYFFATQTLATMRALCLRETEIATGMADEDPIAMADRHMSEGAPSLVRGSDTGLFVVCLGGIAAQMG